MCLYDSVKLSYMAFIDVALPVVWKTKQADRELNNDIKTLPK